ncbi:MAG: ISL3 family transposase [Gillisia sp.]
MSISKVFYTLIGDKNAIFEKAEFKSDHIIFRARLKKHLKRCPYCKSSFVRIKETKERTFRMLNLGEKRTQLKIDVHKVWCQKCDTKAWAQLPFAVGKLPMTKSFMRYILQLTAIATLLAVAIFLGLQWKTVKNIDKANLAKRAKQFSFKKLRYISIDEIAIKKRHKYMTIFTDISTGQIIHAVEGRREEELRPFLKLLAKKAKRLRGIAIDMSAAYACSVRTHLPYASIVFDRFHVTKLMNETIDKIRRAEYAKCKETGARVLKGQRFLLLRNFGDLDHTQKSNLNQLLEINRPLAIAHSMKEQLRLFWDFSLKKDACRFLLLWVIEAMESGVELLEKTARSLLHRAEGLLSYFDHRIDNGKAEGINNKIKVLKRQAYGFHDQEYFKLRLYHLHKKESQLVG